MFNRNKKLDEKIAELENIINKNFINHRDTVDRLKSEHEYAVSKLKQNHKDDLSRLESNQDVVLQNHTAVLEGKLSELTIKTQTQTKEIEMYTKAFENLGFDVKDMKEILNKLVDGLIAKNEIKLVK